MPGSPPTVTELCSRIYIYLIPYRYGELGILSTLSAITETHDIYKYLIYIISRYITHRVRERERTLRRRTPQLRDTTLYISALSRAKDHRITLYRYGHRCPDFGDSLSILATVPVTFFNIRFVLQF